MQIFKTIIPYIDVFFSVVSTCLCGIKIAWLIGCIDSFKKKNFLPTVSCDCQPYSYTILISAVTMTGRGQRKID